MMSHRRRVFERAGLIALLLGNPVFARGVAAASPDSFPAARLPSNGPTWHSSDSGSSDDGGEQSDPEEIYEVLPTANVSLVTESTPEEAPLSNDGYVEAAQEEPIDEEEPSQPLQTLHKLQQMLDETDYITRRPSDSAAKPTDVAAEHTRTPPTHAPDPPAREPKPSTHTESAARQAVSKSVPVVKPDPPEVRNSKERLSPPPTLKNSLRKSDDSPPEKLWTSRDRSKYKKQQRLQKTRARPKTRTDLTTLPAAVSSDDEEASEDFDDGLGYTLPNLPVYFSDAEGDSETETDSNLDQSSVKRPLETPQTPPPIVSQQVRPPYASSGTVPSVPNGYSYGPRPYYPPPPPEAYGQQQQYVYDGQQQTQQQQQQTPLSPQQQQSYPYPQQGYPPYMYPPNTYPYPYPPSYYTSPQQQHMQYLQQQQQHMQQQYWAPPPNTHYPQAQQQRQLPRVLHKPEESEKRQSPSIVSSPPPKQEAPPSSRLASARASTTQSTGTAFPVVVPNLPAPVVFQEPQQTVSPRMDLYSFQKIFALFATVALVSYSAVSPRSLPLAEYNQRFHTNLCIVMLATIVPALNFMAVFDRRENDINTVVHTFFTSFTAGYALAFGLEIVVTTLVRLGVFSWLEPDVFALSPRVPVPILPWVLRENKYRPKRITLFAADFFASCVASPIIEEYIKLSVLRWTVQLPRNFNWVTKTNRKGKKRSLAEAVVRRPGEMEVVNANPYVTHMLAASVGLKLCDAARRILMYTKAQHADKSFYAFCRGAFPIQELCGTMSAVGLAKRDLLGMELPTWKILLPAVVVHGMANFRGMKPIFKWNSSMPWSEMQLSPLQVPNSSSFFEIAKKNYPKIMWFIILSRVLGYCIKNYFMVNRQARKRTTTYAGKHAAFSAELATAEMLKKK